MCLSPAGEVQGGTRAVNHEAKMPAIQIEEPAIEPLTLAEAKAFLRVEHTADDDLIGVLIKAARCEVEAATRRALITQGFRVVMDCWPKSNRVVSPVSPLRSVTAARVRGADGSASNLNLVAFTLDTVSSPGVIDFDRGAVIEPGQRIASIEIEITAGYGESAASVPEPLRQAMRLLIARYYENRDQIESDKLPDAVAALIAPYRVVSL
jgi:uncharacterized phiE125 gp8 family phage protein